MHVYYCKKCLQKSRAACRATGTKLLTTMDFFKKSCHKHVRRSCRKRVFYPEIFQRDLWVRLRKNFRSGRSEPNALWKFDVVRVATSSGNPDRVR